MNHSLKQFEQQLPNYRLPRPDDENLRRIVQKTSAQAATVTHASNHYPQFAMLTLAACALLTVLYFTFLAKPDSSTLVAPHQTSDEEQEPGVTRNTLAISAAITSFDSMGNLSVDVHFENKSSELCLIDVWETVVTGLPSNQGKGELSLGYDLPCTLTATLADHGILKFERPPVEQRHKKIAAGAELPASAITEWRPNTLVLRPGDSATITNQTFTCLTLIDLSTTADLTNTGDFLLKVNDCENNLFRSLAVPATLAKPAQTHGTISPNPVYQLAKRLIALPKEKREEKAILQLTNDLLGTYPYNHDGENSRAHLTELDESNFQRTLSIRYTDKTIRLSYCPMSCTAELRCFDKTSSPVWAIATGPGVPHSKYRNSSTMFAANGEVFMLGLEASWTYIAIFKLETGELVFSASSIGQFETREIKD